MKEGGLNGIGNTYSPKKKEGLVSKYQLKLTMFIWGVRNRYWGRREKKNLLGGKGRRRGSN